MTTKNKVIGGTPRIEAFRVKRIWDGGTGDGVAPQLKKVDWYDYKHPAPADSTGWWVVQGIQGRKDRDFLVQDQKLINSTEVQYSWGVLEALKFAYQNGIELQIVLKRKLFGTGGIWSFYSSEHPDSSKRPYLRVTTTS